MDGVSSGKGLNNLQEGTQTIWLKRVGRRKGGNEAGRREGRVGREYGKKEGRKEKLA